MFRRPPSSTPFPYTTLFRSRSKRPATKSIRKVTNMRLWEDPRVARGMQAQLELRRRRLAAGDEPLGWKVGFGDRKSTRLNSSHANISYAVFCLKKKKESKSS